MKYLWKPGKKSAIWFIGACIVCVFCNISFYFVHKQLIPANIDFLLLLHILLPVSYFLIALFVVLYIDVFLERLISFAPSQKSKPILSALLGTAEIVCVGSIVLYMSNLDPAALATASYEPLQNSIYFKAINRLMSTNNLNSVYSLWSCFSVLFLFILLVCLIVRLVKRIKRSKREKQEMLSKEYHERVLIQENGIEPEFDYTACEFYNQTHLPFYALNQEDGSLGEFLAYYALSKSDIDNLIFLFNRQVPKSDGLCTEIDQILIHNNGLIVLENKHYTTRIFGDASEHDLTIIDHAGHKKSVYNPIRQNEKHVLALQEYLKAHGLYADQEVTPIHSVVVFTADQYDNPDDIISGIDTSGCSSFVCTSQNLPVVVRKLLSESAENLSLNATEINALLKNLPIFEKADNH